MKLSCNHGNTFIIRLEVIAMKQFKKTFLLHSLLNVLANFKKNMNSKIDSLFVFGKKIKPTLLYLS